MSQDLTFKVQESDVVTFAKYSAHNLEHYKKHFQKILYLFLALGLVLASLIWHIGSPRLAIVSGLGVWIIGFLVLYLIKNWSLPKMSVKLFKATFLESEGGVVYSASVEEDALKFKTPRSEAKIHWDKSIQVFESKTHTYIFIAPTQALIINHNSVLSGSLENFLTELKKSIVS